MFSISDSTLTVDGVTEVMELINDWGSLYYSSIIFCKIVVIPGCKCMEIQQRCSTKREIANECASYYVHCHPQPSWTRLASQLYGGGEYTALKKSKSFLPLRGKSTSACKYFM